MPSGDKTSSASTYSALKDIHWSSDTDYMFQRKPDDISNTHYTIVIGRFLREKLLSAVEFQLGRKLVPKGPSGLIDPLKSENHSFVWQFSNAYPSFPEKGISTWSLAQIKDCNKALENGLFSAVSTSDSDSRASKRPRSSSHTPRVFENNRHDTQAENPEPVTPPDSTRSHLDSDQRNTQWKDLNLQLQESRQREKDLQATVAKQAARIAELEKKIAGQADETMEF